MSMKLYAHPFSSYCQKVLIALYENDTPFEFRMLAPGDERATAEHEALWPLKRMPVLVDEGRTVVEATIIIEHLGLRHPQAVVVRTRPERDAAVPVLAQPSAALRAAAVGEPPTNVPGRDVPGANARTATGAVSRVP